MNLIPKFRSFVKEQKDTNIRIHYKDPTCVSKLSKEIEKEFIQATGRPIIIVCIGTDRSTGDALGPIVGSLIKDAHLPNIPIFGTLDQPVHAVNLNETYQKIKQEYVNPFIIGIDACLGRYQNVGMITFGKGPVLPGAGVNKNLPPIGDIHLTGIVNVSGYMEYLVLQNTRLHLVMTIGEQIALSLIEAVQHLNSINDSKTKIHIQSYLNPASEL